MINIQKHNWIGRPIVESVFILGTPFLCCLTLLLIPHSVLYSNYIPEYAWLFLVVFVDVGHVYSTLYRTYVDKPLIYKHKNLFFGLPILLLVISVLLHSISSMLFWRCLAYLAVFHFIRQQYGFFKIYSRKSNESLFKKKLDSFTIYAVTILPIVFWHIDGNRNFNWFIKGDFFSNIYSPILSPIIIGVFWLIVIVYCFSEVHSVLVSKSFNFQKNAIIMGTAMSWYLGIIYFNSDFIFTLLNIVCHGIPYMAIVWIHGKNTKNKKTTPAFLKIIYGRFTLLLFLIPLFVFAYIEEGFWDVLVWKEHNTLFELFYNVRVSLSKNMMNIIVPALTLPQLFHYVIDGFIWKLKNDKFDWSKIL